jgi:hypothetical protein
VENFAAEQGQQTSATSRAQLYLLLGDSKVSSLHPQSPVQGSEKQYRNQWSKNRSFHAHAAQGSHWREISDKKDGTSRE